MTERGKKMNEEEQIEHTKKTNSGYATQLTKEINNTIAVFVRKITEETEENEDVYLELIIETAAIALLAKSVAASVIYFSNMKKMPITEKSVDDELKSTILVLREAVMEFSTAIGEEDE